VTVWHGLLIGLAAVFIASSIGWALYGEYRRFYPRNGWRQPRRAPEQRIPLETRRLYAAVTVPIPLQRVPVRDDSEVTT
jgi:hypothetical protein